MCNRTLDDHVSLQGTHWCYKYKGVQIPEGMLRIMLAVVIEVKKERAREELRGELL